MMKPIARNDTTRFFGAPDDWDEKEGECVGLPITDSDGWLISTWEPTDEERSKIAGGSNVNLWIRGPGHPGVGMSVGDA